MKVKNNEEQKNISMNFPLDKRHIAAYSLFCLVILLWSWGCDKKTSTDKNSKVSVDSTFTNPLLPNGADPSAIYHEDNYYYIKSKARRIILRKTPDITDLVNAEKDTIWIPPKGTRYSKQLWTPEIYNINDNWYIYVVASNGQNRNHRMYVLENTSPDPFEGSFELKARLKTTPGDHWAIDGSVFEHQGTLYFIWSGWDVERKGAQAQNIYIAGMFNPWTINSDRKLISAPRLEWERNWKHEDTWILRRPIDVNEGPYVLKHGEKIHVVYSASGCWTPDYALGRLTANVNSDLLNPASWQKAKEPIFQQSPENGVYGTGHNSFFKSPDGTEDWILYHANDTPDGGCGGNRSPRAQKISWTDDDIPVIGEPVSTSEKLVKPSGTALK